MSETRAYDGPNWRDNPDEQGLPVRRRGTFLAGRGYDNPEIAAVKFGLAEDIQRAVARLGSLTQAEVAARVRAAGVPLSQPDVSAILNGNVLASRGSALTRAEVNRRSLAARLRDSAVRLMLPYL